MPDAVENYWGTEFPVEDDPAPVALLKQQAQKLTEATGGQVEGVVKESAAAGTAYASLYASVPAMGDYQFKILYLAHPVVTGSAEPFPITAEDSFNRTQRIIHNMEDFDRYLKELLQSNPVKKAIGNLIRYSKDRVAS